MNRWRWTRKLMSAAVAVGGATTLRLSACDGTAGQEFRAVAAQNLESGTLSIVTGIVQGVFAVLDPDGADSAN